MGTAVQHRRLIEILGNRVGDEGPGNDQVVGVDRHNDDQDRLGGDQMQGADGHVQRYQAAGKIHGKDEIQHDPVALLEIPAGKRISRRHGHHHVQQCTCQHIDNRVQISFPDTAVLEDLLESVEADVLGPDRDQSLIYQVGITDGRNYHKPQRINDNDKNQNTQEDNRRPEYAVRKAFLCKKIAG